MGTLAAIGATLLEVYVEPPYWLHAAIWLPFIVFGSILSLRWLKAMLIDAQYRLRPEDFR